MRLDQARSRARRLYADQVAAQGRAWQNTANLIRSGFENVWITPALDALQLLVLLSPDGEGDSTEEGGA